MTPTKVEEALGVLRSASERLWDEGFGVDSCSVDEAIATLTAALAESERDAARYRFFKANYFDPPFTHNEIYPEDWDEVIDAAMKDADCELSDAEIDATTDYRGHDPDYDRKDTDHAR